MPIIDTCAVGQIRAAFAAKRHSHIAPLCKGADLSLASALEIASWLHGEHDDETGRSLFRDLGHSAVEAACTLIKQKRAASTKLAGNGIIELSPISELDGSDKRWIDYLMRFSCALQNAGYDSAYARALSYTFHEMADNVRQHAFLKKDGDQSALAGWHVVEQIAAFSVVDLGQGIKTSLAFNPAWAGLPSDRDALLAVVCRRATRVAKNKFGDGYNDVVHNFVSRNGCLALRSGNAELVATGSVLDSNIKITTYPSFVGTRVAAWCAPYGASLPAEPAIKAA